MQKPIKRTKIGGQALLEGLLMKGPQKTCIAVRRADGTIHTETLRTVKNPMQKVPLARGAYAMILSMTEGYKSIMRSADLAFPEGEAEEDKLDKWLREKLGEKSGAAIGLVAGVLGALLSVVLFMLLPTLITGLIGRFVELGGWKTVIEGILKMLIFLLYLFLVTRIAEIHRVFEYHGAEHKTINCYEHGEELTVENVRRSSRFHPRCGTSFMFIVLIISILVFSFIPWGSTGLRMLYKLLALPLVMGISYEVLMFAGSHENWFCRLLAAPGKWVQRLTTFEPDDGQIEVAIVAFKAVDPDAPPAVTLPETSMPDEIAPSELDAVETPLPDEWKPEAAQQDESPQEQA